MDLPRRLIRMAATLVPRDERRRWRGQWEAELAHRRFRLESGASRGRGPSLLRWAAGAVWHALWRRARPWAPDVLASDLRYAVRSLARTPGFATVVALTLALGIGATTLVYSVVDSVLLTPLPYAGAERTYLVWDQRLPASSGRAWVPSVAELNGWRPAAGDRAYLGGVSFRGVNVSGGERADWLLTAQVTGGLLQALGFTPALGRLFVAEDFEAGAGNVAVLTHAGWVRTFGADPSIIGRPVRLDGEPHLLVGVLPPGVELLAGMIRGRAEMLVPLADLASQPPGSRLWTLAKLRPGVGPERFEQILQGAQAAVREAHPELYPAQGEGTPYLQSLHERIVGSAGGTLWPLLGGAVFLLLIACANIANLLLMRTIGRGQELMIREALGASRLRILRMLLTEAVVLATVGGILGVGSAYAGVRVLRSFSSRSIPRLAEVRVDGNVLVIAAAMTLLSCVAFGLVPRLLRGAGRLRDRLPGGRGHGTETGRPRTGNVLVVAEVALAVVLLIGSGLMLRTFLTFRGVELGYDPDRLLTAFVALPASTYPDDESVVTFHRQFLSRVETVPGVEGIGAADYPPGEGMGASVGLQAVGESDSDDSRVPAVSKTVSPGYFETMGIPLVAGRVFEDDDDLGTADVVVLNEAAAEELGIEPTAVGAEVRLTGAGGSMMGGAAGGEVAVVVGIVGNVRLHLLETAPRPAVYRSFYQAPSRYMNVIVRSFGEPLDLVPSLRAELAAIDPDQGLHLPPTMSTVRERLAGTVADRAAFGRLLGGFSVVGLLLACVGVYGVLGFSVERRTHEIGVRRALGAGKGAVVALFVRRGLLSVGFGLALGIFAALVLGRYLERLLFGVTPTDPATFVATSLALFAAAAIAAWLPARRAARVEPVRALRVQ